MLRVPSLKMKRLGYLIAYSLVLLVYRSLPIIAMPRKKCGELIRRLLGQPFSVPAEKRRVGSVHLLGPDQWLAVINSALTQLSEEDPALYSAITSGRKCVIFAGGTATGDHYFEYGTFFFGRALVKSTDGLIAFFVFWHYFNLASSWLERSDSDALERAKAKAREQTSEWIEAHAGPAPIAEWVRTRRLEKRFEPPKPLKRVFRN